MKRFLVPSGLLIALAAAGLSGCSTTSPATDFTLSSPDLQGGSFDNKFVLNGFGCTGENVSPELVLAQRAGRHEVACAAGLRPGRAHRQRLLALGRLQHPAHDDRPAAGRGQQPGHAARRRLRRQHRFHGHRRHRRQRQLRRPLPAAGRQAAPLHLHDLRAGGRQAWRPPAACRRTGSGGAVRLRHQQGPGAALLGKASFTATYGR